MLEKIISLMADCLEREADTIKGSDLFREFEEWDSLAYLSVIAQIDDDFGIVVPIEDFRACKTVHDLADYVSKNTAQ